MAAIKFIVFAAVVACAFAVEEDVRAKKDVLLGTYPFGYSALPYSYGYDDGKYYPGKYEKAYVAPSAYLPAVSAYSALPAAAALPAATALPYSYGAAYGAYPYSYGAYGAYPSYYKPYVY